MIGDSLNGNLSKTFIGNDKWPIRCGVEAVELRWKHDDKSALLLVKPAGGYGIGFEATKSPESPITTHPLLSVKSAEADELYRI